MSCCCGTVGVTMGIVHVSVGVILDFEYCGTVSVAMGVLDLLLGPFARECRYGSKYR